MVQSSSDIIHVIDDFYPDHLLPEVQKWALTLPTDDTWYDLEDLFYGHDLFIMSDGLFNVNGAVGCEMHINYHTPHKHYDKDEELFRQTGKLSFPLCGIVYYPFINMEGGQIVFPDAGIAITPKTNRAIFFKGNLLHDGVPFVGTRQSIGINPWREVPLTYRGQ